jgi:2-polyprenyl-3-methyl-5-hydroxy-6-metoxy-1,4-benzoquinol methylase
MHQWTKEKVLVERGKIVEAYGPWTTHDIELLHGVSTLDAGLHTKWRVDFFDKLIQESSPELRYGSARMLDLASLEGLFTIEFARMGAETIGLEIRDANLAKARFAQSVIGLTNCRFVKGDVRKIPKEFGNFDTIICAGILYHLDFPDCVIFLRDIAERSTDLIIIDSHLAYDRINPPVYSLSKMQTYEFEGRKLRGRKYLEHAAQTAPEEKVRNLWASIDNDYALWIDERDVISMMRDAGFVLSIKRFPNPEYEKNYPDRPTLVFKRTR